MSGRFADRRQPPVEILGLRDVGASSDVDRMRTLIVRLVDLIADSVPPASSGNSGEIRERVGAIRTSLGRAQQADEVLTVADEVVAVCRGALDALRRERAGTGSELAAILGIIRDAMITIGGEEAGYSSDLTNTATRLEALQRIPNLEELKRHLIAEVRDLKNLVAAREQRWRATMTTFERRVDALEQQLAETSVQATIDPLTAVENRRGVEARFAVLKNGARQLVLALVDLDGFKLINDSRGHDVGDQVLVAVARALRESVRSGDVVGRMGGDEFVILLENLTLRQAEHRLRSLMDKVSQSAAEVAVRSGGKPQVSASCGVAELSAGDTLASLLKRADEALYTAKRMGKSRVVAKEAPLMRDLARR